MKIPAYFNNDFFSAGEKVTYSGFDAVVIRHYAEGMWEIRLWHGCVCVSGFDLIKK